MAARTRKSESAFNAVRLFMDAERASFQESLDKRIAERAFEIYETSGFVPGQELSNWLGGERELLPIEEVIVSNKSRSVTASVPADSTSHLDILVDGRRAIISTSNGSESEGINGGSNHKIAYHLV